MYVVSRWRTYIPSQRRTEAEHISFWTICLSHPSIIGAFSGIRKDLVLIEIPLPQVTEQDDQALHSEASHPGVTVLSSNMAAKEARGCEQDGGEEERGDLTENLCQSAKGAICKEVCVR